MSGSFKHNQARKNVAIGGLIIVFCITVISMFSSYKIYRPAFEDIGGWSQIALSLFCVLAVEGCFIWLVYGFSKAFSSVLEKGLSLLGIAGLLTVMTTNIITHAMLSKGYQLAPFQADWLTWGSYGVLVGILILVLVITLADPVSRLLRIELRVKGREEEAILTAKGEALNSERIQTAMMKRANTEAERLASQIEDDAEGEEDTAPLSLGALRAATPRRVAHFALSRSSSPTEDGEDDVGAQILTTEVTRNKLPRPGDGFYFRANGSGWELRRNVYDGNGVRKQPHIAHLSATKWAQMKSQNRTERELRGALQEWLTEKISG